MCPPKLWYIEAANKVGEFFVLYKLIMPTKKLGVCLVHQMFYISTSISMLHTPKTGQDMPSHIFCMKNVTQVLDMLLSRAFSISRHRLCHLIQLLYCVKLFKKLKKVNKMGLNFGWDIVTCCYIYLIHTLSLSLTHSHTLSHTLTHTHELSQTYTHPFFFI